jgi:cell division cycle 20-like protein 1 (cofactor of APC complex)
LLEIESPASFSAVKWCDRNEIIAVGDDSGTVRIYDVVKAKILKTYDNHN